MKEVRDKKIFFNSLNTYSHLFMFICGFNALVIQSLYLREMFAFFQGNELIIAMVMCLWLLLTSLGSTVGIFIKRCQKKYDSLLLLMMILFFIVSLFIFYRFNTFFIPYGIMPGPLGICVAVSLVIMPVCLISGFIFTCLNNRYSQNVNDIVKFYASDVLGSIAGGLIFGLGLLIFLSTYLAIIALVFINIIFIGLLMIRRGHAGLSVLSMFSMVIIFAIMVLPGVKNYFYSGLYPDQHLIEIKENRYGRIMVNESGNQINVFKNGMLVNMNHNEMEDEESVHYAMLQHDSPEKVLIIGGGIGGKFNEIRKYGVVSIDYVDTDPLVNHIEKKYYSEISTSGSRFIYTDPRKYIRKNVNNYDVVLMNTSAPDNILSNRFYTLEFFRELKQRMNDQGVLCLSMPASENYMNDWSVLLNSSIFNTLKQVFAQVILIPGNRFYFVVSDASLSENIAALTIERGIENVYVNEYYINDEMNCEKAARLKARLDVNARINHDFKPVSYYYGFLFWLSRYGMSLKLPVWVLSLLLLIMIIFLKPHDVGLVTAGVIGASAEIILLVAFQAMAGYAFSQSGLFIALFMVGMFAGSYWLSGYFSASYKSFTANMMIQLALLLLMAGYLFMAGKGFFTEGWGTYMFLIAIATTTGLQFAICVKIKRNSPVTNAGISYSLDLIGSGIGIFLLTVFVIPYFGLTGSSLLLAGFNVLIITSIAIKSLWMKNNL